MRAPRKVHSHVASHSEDGLTKRLRGRSTQEPKANDEVAAPTESRASNNSPKAITVAARVREPQSNHQPNATGVVAGVPDDLRFVDPTVITIREMWRRRQAWHRAEKSLTLSASAICRRVVGVKGKADKAGLKLAAQLLERIEKDEENSDASLAVMPLLMARRQIEPHRLAVEKVLGKLALQLPVAHVVESTTGFGALSLAGIVGEAGALDAYHSTRGLWKRMGLAVINGERQRRKSDPVDALEHGYSPSRRSAMWNVGGALIGAMGLGPRPRVGEDVESRNDLSPWQKLFIARMRWEAERNPEHRREDAERKGEVFESYSKHAANRARRYVEKIFLKQLRQEWKNAAVQSPSENQGCPGRRGAEQSQRRTNANHEPVVPLTNSNTAVHRPHESQSKLGRRRAEQSRHATKASVRLAAPPTIEELIYGNKID